MVVERPGHCSPYPPLGQQRHKLLSLGYGIFGHLLPACVAHAQGTCTLWVLPMGLTGSCSLQRLLSSEYLHLAVQDVSESLQMLFHVSANRCHLGGMVLNQHFSIGKKSAASLSACSCFSSHLRPCSSFPHQVPLPSSSPPVGAQESK